MLSKKKLMLEISMSEKDIKKSALAAHVLQQVEHM